IPAQQRHSCRTLYREPVHDPVQYVDGVHLAAPAHDLAYLGLAETGRDTDLGLACPGHLLDPAEKLPDVAFGENVDGLWRRPERRRNGQRVVDTAHHDSSAALSAC